MRRVGSSAAFSLVEVAAAAAILVVSVLAGTSLAMLASRHIAAVDESVADRDAALELLTSLEQLPYTAPAGTPSLTGEVFPHAQTARNSAVARYVAAANAGLPADCFATQLESRGRTLLLVARYLERDAAGAWSVVADAALAGQDFAVCAPSPALLLEVHRCRRAGSSPLASRLFAARPARSAPAAMPVRQ